MGGTAAHVGKFFGALGLVGQDFFSGCRKVVCLRHSRSEELPQKLSVRTKQAETFVERLSGFFLCSHSIARCLVKRQTQQSPVLSLGDTVDALAQTGDANQGYLPPCCT